MTNHDIESTILKPKPNYSNGSVQKSQDRKKHDKSGEMLRFCSLFSSMAMAWWIKNSYHKVVRSIRNTILKLCNDCAKQFIRNAQNCGKFCGWILHHDKTPARTPMFVRRFFAKNKTVIMPQPPYSSDLAPAYFFLLPKLKTPMKGKGVLPLFRR